MISPGQSIGNLPEISSGHILSGRHSHLDTARFHGFVLRAGGNELRSTSASATKLEVDMTACANSLAGNVGGPRCRPSFREENVRAVRLPHEEAGATVLEYCVIQQLPRWARGVEHRA